MGEDELTAPDYMQVHCGGQVHKIYATINGPITLVDHADVPLQVLAAEYVLTDGDRDGCFQIAAAVLGELFIAKGGDSLPPWLVRIQEALLKKRSVRSLTRNDRAPVELPLPDRIYHHDYFLLAKLKQYARRVTFRKASYVDVGLAEKANVVGSWRPVLPPVNHGTKGVQAIQHCRQQVRIVVNPAEWGRVLKLGVAVVGNFFVLKVLRIWADNDLVVVYAKQSKQASVVLHHARVRRGDDGVWRVKRSLGPWSG